MHPELEQAFDLSGQVAVVTGAGGGIGAAVALALGRAGAEVVLVDRDRDRAETSAATLVAEGHRARVVEADVAQRAAVEGAAAAALEGPGRLDVWVNGAGVLRHAPLLELAEDELDLLLEVNVKGTVWGCAAAGRAMAARGSGSIVNLVSAGIDRPVAGTAAYALSKSAVAMLTRTAAAELGPSGVRVNAVAPAFIPTDMVAPHWTGPDGALDEDRRREVLDRWAAQTPLGTVGEPADVALAVLYLAGAASRFVTGQVLRPNGGWAMP